MPELSSSNLSSNDNRVSICEVGPRDGLQSEKRIWSVDERVEFINRLARTGLDRIEAVSFVNPKRVPQMADAESVMAKIDRPDGVKFAGLALNLKGVERALDSGVDEVRYVVVATETFNMKNQGSSIEDTFTAFEGIAKTVKAAGKRLSGTIGVTFGCPFEGEVPLEQVVKIARRYVDAGVDEIGLADTIGCAVPNQITERVGAVMDAVGPKIDLTCHFHNTRNTGIANAAAAVMAGVRMFDASLGGIGGCPFAPRATGNIASDDLAWMLRQMGYETGIDLDALMDVANWLEGYFPAPLPGQIMKAGLFPEVAKAS
jgi:hydroxymethylglutaryl-CoA lyase